jgi:hypothetical protein
MTFDLTEEERLLVKALLKRYTEQVLILQEQEEDPLATAHTLDVASGIFKKLSSK